MAKQQRSIEKQLKRKGAPVAAHPRQRSRWRNLPYRPKPKVVDTTALPRICPRRARNLRSPSCAARKRPRTALDGLTTSEMGRETTSLPGIDLLEEHDSEGRVAADPAELERIQQTLDRNARASSASPSRRATSPRARPSRATKSIPPKACAWTRSSASSATSPAPPVPSASTSSRPFPARTRSASRSPTRKKIRRCTLRELLEVDDLDADARRSSRSRSARTFTAKRSSPISPRCRTCSSPAPPAPARASASTRIIARMLYRFTPGGSALHHDRSRRWSKCRSTTRCRIWSFRSSPIRRRCSSRCAG